MTERDLLDQLWARLTHVAPMVGGPPRYVMAEQVRYDPTHGGCIADALAIDTWGSGGYQLEGYEVKCTRSDWRRELASGVPIHRARERGQHDLQVPYVKSYPWRRHCARWYILAPTGVVPTDELPDGWGLIEAGTRGLRSRVRAANVSDVEPLSARQVAGLMRATQQTATDHARRTLTT